MNTKNWAISKTKNIVVDSCTDTTAGTYPIRAYTAMRKFFTQAEARLFRRTYTGKDRVQVINTRRLAVSR